MSNETPSWDHYRSFLGVVREGSLSGAARALALTQPTLARHVDQLEQALGGARLFSRSPQGLQPTAVALRLVPHAEVMASSAAALMRAAAGDEATLAGVVRISVSDVIGAEVLPPVLRDLRAAQPGLVFEVVLSNASTDLLRRDADIAIRMTSPAQKALVARRAGVVVLGLHAHPDYLALRGTPRSFAELAGHDVIGFDRDRAAGGFLAQTGLPLERERFTIRIDNQIAQLAAIRAGCGIGVCQAGLARRQPRLERLLAEAVSVPLETWIVMHEDLRGDPRMRVVFDHLHSAMSAYAKEVS